VPHPWPGNGYEDCGGDKRVGLVTTRASSSESGVLCIVIRCIMNILALSMTTVEGTAVAEYLERSHGDQQ
jgi:hypothetical protein